MKVAIVHDSLAEFGGAERVLQCLLDLFPEAHLYTAYTDNTYHLNYLTKLQLANLRVSFLEPFHVRHHTSFVQAIAPLVWRSFHLDSYDLVISHGWHIMSCLVHVPHGIHIACIQSPPKNIFGIAPPTPLQRAIRYDTYMRPMYRKALHNAQFIVANSKNTQKALREYVGVTSDVIYPPVTIPPHAPKKPNGTFYLCVSRIAPDKHLELAIIAANKLRVPLKIVGITNTPPYERYLKRLAGPTVAFLGFRSDATLTELYAKSIALIFPSRNEDFGIAPLEAAAHGVPVIAYYGGGAKETVVDGKTGTFFHTHSPKSLARAMMRLKTMHFDPHTLYRHAQQFSTNRFKREFMDYVSRAIRSTSADTSGRSG